MDDIGFCAIFIREAITIWDAEERERKLKEEEDEDEDERAKKKDHKGKGKARQVFDWNQIHLGSSQPEVTFAELEHSTASDPAFYNFRDRLESYLELLLSIPENRPIQLRERESIAIDFKDNDTVRFDATLQCAKQLRLSDIAHRMPLP